MTQTLVNLVSFLILPIILITRSYDYDASGATTLARDPRLCPESWILTAPDDKRHPSVSVVVLNYNGEKFVECCLRSLDNQTLLNFELLLVDNGSVDNSLSVMRSFCARTKIQKCMIIANPENLGYCLGNNNAIRRTSSEYIVLLNSDTCVSSDWLEKLVRSAEIDEQIGICQSKLLYENMAINSTGNLCDIYGFTWGRGRFERDTSRYDTDARGFFYASGASLLIKRTCISQVGGFDERLFAYHDDVDLCWRARLMGFGISYVPSSVCFHKESQVLPAYSATRFFLTNRNRIRVLLKNCSGRRLIPRILIATVLIFLVATFRCLLSGSPAFIQQATRSLVWNLQILPDTLRERKRTRLLRRVNDGEVEKYMTPYSLEICQLALILRGIMKLRYQSYDLVLSDELVSRLSPPAGRQEQTSEHLSTS